MSRLITKQQLVKAITGVTIAFVIDAAGVSQIAGEIMIALMPLAVIGERIQKRRKKAETIIIHALQTQPQGKAPEVIADRLLEELDD